MIIRMIEICIGYFTFVNGCNCNCNYDDLYSTVSSKLLLGWLLTGARRTRHVYRKRLWDTRPYCAGEGRSRRVQPVPDTAEGIVQRRQQRKCPWIHSLSHSLLYLHTKHFG